MSILHTQKLTLSILVVLVVSLILGVFFSDFYTKGEPREALVAQAMIDSGNYVLPVVYGDEYAYKPPMAHWLMALTALLTNGGIVTEAIARTPSALALIVLVLSVYIFFRNRVQKRISYLLAFVLMVTFEVHRAGITARVDMLLTMFVVLTLLSLYLWEEKQELQGIPIGVVLLISGGILTKGPVAVVLPLLTFMIYLLCFKKYRVLFIARQLLIVLVLSLLLPSLWYYQAWKIGGSDFLTMALAENFMRFFHITPETIHYPLGHEKPFYYVFVYLLSGALPWTFLLFLIPWWRGSFFKSVSQVETRVSGMRWRRLEGLRKVHLFSAIVVAAVLLFYMCPSSKRSVYLLPLYPFLSLFIAEALMKMAMVERRALRWFSYLMVFVGMLSFLIIAFLCFGWYRSLLSLLDIALKPKLLHTLDAFHLGLVAYPSLSILLGLSLLMMVLATIYQLHRGHNTKVIYTSLMIMYMLHLNIDGPLMMGFKKEHSAERFAQVVCPIIEKDNSPVYTVSRLKEGITNLYGLAYYAHLHTLPFDQSYPDEGYLVIWEKDVAEVQASFLQGYHLDLVATDTSPIQEGGVAMLFWFEKE